MNFPQKTILVSLLLLFAVSCGGGGGGGGSSSSATVIRAGGTITAAASSAVDSDVNDINAPYLSNDAFGFAQSIPNPVTLGGYVNRPNTGATGRSYLSGDTDDYFTATLVTDQVITLLIGNNQTANLDLYLYNSGQTLISSSTGTGQTESITVPADGSYFILVHVDSGYSNYVLSIGQSAALAGAETALDPYADFVPGEIIVRFKDHAFSFGSMAEAGAAPSQGLIKKAGSRGNVELMDLGNEDNRQRIFDHLGISIGAGKTARALLVGDERSRLKLDTISVIEALRKRSDVLYAEPNYIRYASLVPDDTYYSLQWHYSLINLPQAWGITTGISSVIVAVIDTGVLLSHPDLLGQFVSGYDFISSAANALDGDGIDSDPDDPGDEGAGGSSFHGTHVAGTVAAATDNAKGVAGIAWGIKIMPVRVLGKLGGTSYDLMQSIKFASGIANDSGTLPAQTADIINLSLGGGSYSQAEQDVITQARSTGVIIIAAAGNSNSSSPSYPAAYDGVVSVSAVDMEKNRSYYSNYGSTIDIAAPGGDLRVDTNGDGYYDGVLSTLGDDSSGSIKFIYAFYQGTSMAAPHVAGVAALMKSERAGLTPAEFDTWLEDGDLTEDIGTTGRDDDFGFGLIDAHKALIKAGGAPASPLLAVNPSSLNFGSSGTSSTLSATNGGGGTLTLSAPTDDVSWLTVSASVVDADNLGTYAVTVIRSGLADGTYTATITFTSSANTVTVPVIIQVSTDASAADAGYHYVLLLDPQTYDTKYQFSVGADNAAYSYLFSSITSGEYIIMAGSDLNNNNVICDPGEACGAYRTLNDPTTVNVNGDFSGLDFSSGSNLIFEGAFQPGSTGAYGVLHDRVIRRIR